jgi:Ca2+-binding RTX toxin-like protein
MLMHGTSALSALVWAQPKKDLIDVVLFKGQISMSTEGTLFNDTSAPNLFNGGVGSDTVSFANSERGVVADLSSGTAYKTLRIMPLGDSITYGVIANKAGFENTESGGYRKLLWDDLVDQGIYTDFVGSQVNGPLGFDSDHQGHRGWTINQLDASANQFLTAADPDAVLLIAGTNDSSSDSLTQMVNDLRALLIKLTNSNPSMPVFVGSLPPVVVGQQSQERADRVDAFNDAMPGLIAELRAAGRDVVFVDMRALTTTDVTAPPADSGLHPTATGYEKIAAYWFDALADKFDISSTGIGSDRDTFVSIENLIGSDHEDRLAGDSAANVLTGGAGADWLDGRGGNDRIIGGTGADFLIGGGGNDTFVFRTGDGRDTIADFNQAGDDRIEVQGYTAYTGLQQVGADTLVVFSATDDILLKGVQSSSLTDADFFFVDAPVVPTFPTGSIVGTANNDTLNGTSGADVIYGLAGNDVIDGKKGGDTMIGGTGNDSYFVDNSKDKVVEELNEGIDEVHAFISWTLAANVENMFLRSAAVINGTGNELDNAITGNSAANVLTGGAGADRLDGRGGNDRIIGGTGADFLLGGDGNDTFVFRTGDGRDTIADFNQAGDDRIEVQGHTAYTLQQVGADTLVVFSATDDILLKGVQPSSLTDADFFFVDAPVVPTFPTGSIVGTANNDTLNGTSGADVIYGLAGNDVIDGKGGGDTMIGGTGNDSYFVDNSQDKVVEEVNEGIDEVHAFISWTLAANVENLFLRGAAVINGTGNELDNAITGNSAANVLTGGIGADFLVGGGGNDTFVFRTGDGRDTIADFNQAGDDRIEVQGYTAYTGLQQVGADTLVVFSATDDILLKGVQSSSLTDADFFFVDAPVVPTFPTGSIVGTANNDTLNGTSGADVIYGLAGNDVIDGKKGGDTMIGGTGNDSYFVDNSKDKVVEEVNEGIDEVHAFISWTLAANVENMFLRSAAVINGTGNELDNAITGNSAANVLTGGAGADRLDGRGGNDRIIGGTGADFLLGGDGNDTFVFRTGDGRDTIADFNQAGDDRIEVQGYTAYTLQQVGADTLVVFSATDDILLKGVQSSSLTDADFFFV